MTSITNRCESSGLRMTEQRRVIAKVLDVSKDHPDVDIIILVYLKLITQYTLQLFIEQ